MNDLCINGSLVLLQELFLRDPQHCDRASQCVVFSTYDLHRIHYKASDAELWRNTHRREYWSKTVWIIPIHRRGANHWVMAVLYLERKEVHLYDSFGSQPAWHQDVQVCYFQTTKIFVNMITTLFAIEYIYFPFTVKRACRTRRTSNVNFYRRLGCQTCLCKSFLIFLTECLRRILFCRDVPFSQMPMTVDYGF